jgi:putative membrane protein
MTGVHVDGFTTALIVAVVLGLLNIFIKPIYRYIDFANYFYNLRVILLVINA